MDAGSAPLPVSVLPDELNQALLEFNLMLRYALSEGLEIDEPTRKTIAAVQQTLLQSKIVAGTQPPKPAVITAPEPSFPKTPEPPFAVPPEPEFAEMLMSAHAALAKLIAPATPLSLAATEPTEHLGYVGNPPLIFWMIVIAIVSAVGFVITGVICDSRIQASPTGSISQTLAIVRNLNWCFAASLGAVFYVLFTSLQYVKNRTFDPRYNSIYVIRLVLGILAGLILAVVLQSSFFANNASVKHLNFAPAIIALLGGFSTEAVYQILQRMVDMMLAAIRGDDSGATKTKVTDSARTQLLKLADEATDPEMKSKVLAAVKKVGA